MSTTYTVPLTTLAGSATADAAWWVGVARALDALDDRLAHDAAVDDGPTGALAEAVTRSPALANAVTRLRAERARIVECACRLRRRIAQLAGDQDHADDVRTELDALATREAAYRRRSREVFWDSFARDIGGE